MKEKDNYPDQLHSYLSLRKAVGWIGILLPFVLMSGVMLFSDGDFILKNISLYYHTVMRDLFVGALCSIALFLFFYRGYDQWDNRTADLAGVFALGIAFFPTVEDGPYNWQATVHFISAVCFFITLASISLFLFTRGSADPTGQKLKRNRIYRLCGSVMLLSMLLILVYLIFFEKEYPDSSLMFWAETSALIAFGISWLTKGGSLYPDRK